jgi:iron complex transport system substrate-binding protein
VTAVKNGAIYAVPGSVYSTPGPRLVQGLEQLAKLLHPERFATSAAQNFAVPVASGTSNRTAPAIALR